MYANRGLPLRLKGMNALSMEATLSKLFRLPSELGSILKGKNLLPSGANSFLLEWTLFRKDLLCMKANKNQKSCLPCEKGQKFNKVYHVPLKEFDDAEINAYSGSKGPVNARSLIETFFCSPEGRREAKK